MYQNIIGWVALLGVVQYFGLGEFVQNIAAGISEPAVMLGHAVEFVRSAMNH